MGKVESFDRYINGDYTQQDKAILKKHKILIKKEYSQSEVVEMIKHRNFNNCIPKKCEWCGKKVLVIHEHHYPVEKRNGGKDIVKICPSCHSEYHLLINGNYELNKEVI